MSVTVTPSSLYLPLTKDDEIRLVELESGPEYADICCTFKHVRLSEQPLYEALSYEWGPLDHLKAIHVNEQWKDVRGNLWSALQHLRQEKKSRLLWIDALCIHQEDTFERNHQVNQMGAIYSQAERVIVWLGPPDSSSRTAFKLIRQANSLPSSSLDMAFRLRRSHLDVTNIPTERDLIDFRDFCWRSYWLRLWVVQEILLAKDIVIQSGNDWSEWNHLCNMFTIFGRMTKALGAGNGPASRINTILASIPSKLCEEWVIFRDKRCGIDQTPRPWVKILRHYKRCQCQELKDRMLALRALAPPCCQEAVHADYTLSVAALCTALLSHQLIHHISSGSYEAMQVLEILGLNDRCFLSGGMANVEVIERLERMSKEDLTLDS